MDYLFLVLTIPSYILAVVLWKARIRLKRIGEYKSFLFVAINAFLGILGAQIGSFQALFLERKFQIENSYGLSLLIMAGVVALLYFSFVYSKKEVEA